MLRPEAVARQAQDKPFPLELQGRRWAGVVGGRGGGGQGQEPPPAFSGSFWTPHRAVLLAGPVPGTLARTGAYPGSGRDMVTLASGCVAFLNLSFPSRTEGAMGRGDGRELVPGRSALGPPLLEVGGLPRPSWKQGWS